jgi:hypothetical protein
MRVRLWKVNAGHAGACVVTVERVWRLLGFDVLFDWCELADVAWAKCVGHLASLSQKNPPCTASEAALKARGGAQSRVTGVTTLALGCMAGKVIYQPLP